MRTIDVVFDGPPGPESGRFVEVESPPGTSICAGEWFDRGDGMWALRLPSPTSDDAARVSNLWTVLDNGGVVLHTAGAGWHMTICTSQAEAKMIAAQWSVNRAADRFTVARLIDVLTQLV